MDDLSTGLGLTFLALVFMSFVAPTGRVVGEHGEYAFPAALYIVWVLKGFGMALVHNCSFPMVVELCSSKKIGKFTAIIPPPGRRAHTPPPLPLGGGRRARRRGRTPVYSSVLILCDFGVFTALVKNIKANKVANAKGLEALGDDD